MSDKLPVSIVIGIDNNDAQKVMDGLADSLKKVDSTGQGLAQTTKANTDATQKYTEETEKSTKAQQEDVIATQAKIANLEKLGATFKDLSMKIFSFGEDLVNSAVTLGRYEAQIRNLSKSSEEAGKSLDFVKQFAMSAQPFNVLQLTQASAEITKFHLSVTNLLPKIADMAAEFKTDIAPAAEIVSKALNGTRGGMMALQSQYGLTAEELVKYGAVMNNAGQIEGKSLATKQAIVKWLDSMSGAAKNASSTYGTALNQYNNAIEVMKVSLGKELLPTLIDLLHRGTDIIKWLDSFSQGSKNLTANLILVGGGATALVSTLTSIGLQGASAVKTFQALTQASKEASGAQAFMSTSISASTLGLGALAVVCGAVVNHYIDMWYQMEKQKSDKIVEECKKVADGLKLIKDHMDAIKSGSPVKVAVEMSPEEVKKATEGALQQVKNVIDSEMGDIGDQIISYKTKKTVTKYINPVDEKPSQVTQDEGIAPSPSAQSTIGFFRHSTPVETTEEIVEQKKISEAYKENMEGYEALLKKREEGAKLTDEETKKFKEYANVLNQIYETVKKSNPQKAQEIELRMKEIGVLQKAKDIQNQTPPEKEKPLMQNLSNELQYQENLLKSQTITHEQYIANLNKFLTDYKVTDEEIAAIKAKIVTEESEYGKKQNEIAQKNWKEYLEYLTVALRNGQITQGDYFKAIDKYEQDNNITAETNYKLWLDIQNSASKEFTEIKKKQLAEEKKIATEEKKEQDEKLKRTIQIEASELETSGKIVEAKKKLLQIQEIDMRNHGMTDIEIARWEDAEIEKIDFEFAEKKKKLDKQRIEKTLEAEKLILQAKIETGKREYDMAVDLVNRRKDILLLSGANQKIVEEEALNSMHELYQKDLDNFKNNEELKLKEAETVIEKKKVQMEADKVDAVTISNLVAEEEKKAQQEVFQDFLSKEKQKREEVKKTADEIKDLDAQIVESKKKISEMEKEQNASSDLSALQMMPGFSPLGSGDVKNPHIAPWMKNNEAIQTEKDKIKTLEEEKQKKQSELNKLKIEERDVTKATLDFQNQYNIALDGTFQKLTDINKLMKDNNSLTTPPSSTGNGAKGEGSPASPSASSPKYLPDSAGNTPSINPNVSRTDQGWNRSPVGGSQGQSYNVPVNSGNNAINYGGSTTDITNIYLGDRTVQASSQTAHYAEGLTNDALKYGDVA